MGGNGEDDKTGKRIEDNEEEDEEFKEGRDHIIY